MKNLVSLMQDDYTTVQVVFQRPENAPVTASTGKRYTYKVRKGTATVGSFAVVEVGERLALVKVVEVDAVPKIDQSAAYKYKWILQIVDRAEYDHTLAVEAKFDLAVEAAQKAHQLKLLTAHLPIEAIYRESLS
jgi:hypothetical protein